MKYGNQNKWYAIYCKSRHERQVHLRLQQKGIHSYLADYETRVLWGTRWRKVRRNVLPGYLLIYEHMSPQRYLEILQTTGVVKFVGGYWPKLSWIPEDQVRSLQILLGSKQTFEEIPYFNQGDWVEVVAGPLQGLRGRVKQVGKHRTFVVVSIDLLQRSAALHIDSGVLKKIHRRMPAEEWE